MQQIGKSAIYIIYELYCDEMAIFYSSVANQTFFQRLHATPLTPEKCTSHKAAQANGV